jgi:hypothetical protein
MIYLISNKLKKSNFYKYIKLKGSSDAFNFQFKKLLKKTFNLKGPNQYSNSRESR